ncbi:MAG: DUF1564 domain-containing protein [Leptospira sp.]|nr:DUF1564 domain-containing protein [Leptospira sp.]
MKFRTKSVRHSLIITNKNRQAIKLGDDRMTSSSFTIPRTLVPIIYSKIGRGSRIDKYLHIILNKYRILGYSGSLPRFSGSKLKYQERIKDGKRFDFRPYCADWCELRILASMHGMTMTRFFTVLLKLESSEFGNALDAALRGLKPKNLLNHPISYTQTLWKNSAEIIKYGRFGVPTFEFSSPP